MTDTATRGQFLTFTLDGEAYGVDILAVQEIKGGAAVTPVPNTPRHVRGVMNLRGAIVPVVDLRLRLGMAPAEEDQAAVIVVVRVGTHPCGLAVDSVSDVLDLAPEAIEPPPAAAARAGGGTVRGIAKAEDRLVVLLDVERLIADDVGTA
jgi:purine-binding chemotaxis protein CheW